MPLNFLNTGYFSENVGIGTNSPTASLDIQANLAVNGSYTSSGWAKYIILDAENTGGGGIIWTKQSSTYNRAIVNNQGKFEIGRSTANDDSADWITDLAITPTGYVGIGTDAPVSALHIKLDQGTTNSIMRLRGENTTARQTKLQFEDYKGTLADAFINFVIPTADTAVGAYLGLGVNNSSTLVVDNSDKVGIGTTDPSAKLSINAGAQFINFSGRDTIVQAANDPTNANIYTTQAGVGDFAQLSGSLVLQARTQGTIYRDIIFAGGLGTVASPATQLMTILGEGNVGIGTSNPDAKLHIYGSSALSEMYLGEDADTDKAGILKYAQGDGSGTGVITLSHYGNTSVTQSLAIKYGGNVGIGTITPAAKLVVGGDSAEEIRVLHESNGTTVLRRDGAVSYLLSESGGTANRELVLGSQTSAGGTIQGRLRINSGGDVLMGNTVVNPASGFSNQRGFGYDNSTGNLEVASTSGTPMTIGRNKTDAGVILVLRKESNITHSFGSTDSYILSNVGIGATTTPDYKLDIEGTLGVSDLPFNTSSVSVLVANETIGSEIITNGEFTTNLTNWTNDSTYSWTSATWTASGVSLQTSGSAQYKSFYQDIGPITSGKTYKIIYSAVKTSGTMRVGVETSPVGSSVGYQKALTSSEVVNEIFTATVTDATCVISFWGQNDSSTNEWVIDNVSIKEVISASDQIQKSELHTIPRTNPAASLYDLIPNGAFTTTYAFTSTAGTYAEVMSGDDVITETGTYSVQMVVNDFAVGGTQYDEKYSGVMTWHATSTNDNGVGSLSEIVLHRAGHAGNQGITYLRTRETTDSADPGPNQLKLEIMCNRTYTSASNVIFKFVRLI